MVMTISLDIGVVGCSVRGVASTGISLAMSPELSIGDVGKAAEGDVVLAPSLAIGWVACNVWGVVYTGSSLAMSP